MLGLFLILHLCTIVYPVFKQLKAAINKSRTDDFTEIAVMTTELYCYCQARFALFSALMVMTTGVLKSVHTFFSFFQTVKCTLEETDLMSSDPFKLDIIEGQTVEIYSACQQNSSDGLKCLCYQRFVSVRWMDDCLMKV